MPDATLGPETGTKQAVHRMFTLLSRGWEGGGEPVSKPLMLGNTYQRRRQRVEMLKTWFHPGGMVPTLALGGQATLELTPEIRRTLTEDLLSARLP